MYAEPFSTGWARSAARQKGRRVDEAHRTEGELPFDGVAQDGVHDAQRAQQPLQEIARLAVLRIPAAARRGSSSGRTWARAKIARRLRQARAANLRCYNRRHVHSLSRAHRLLTEETTETLYLLGEDARIVSISGFTVRPPRARGRSRRSRPSRTRSRQDSRARARPCRLLRSAADIAAELVRRGIEVWISNHRSVDAILGYVRRLGAMVGANVKAERYVDGLQARIDQVANAAALLTRRPRVYFEEWDEPQISAIRWVSELMGHRRWRRHLPRMRSGEPRPRPHHRGSARRGGASSRHHHRLMVRQEVPPRARGDPQWLARDTRGARRRAARDQVSADPATGAGGSHRRPGFPASDNRNLVVPASGVGVTDRTRRLPKR